MQTQWIAIAVFGWLSLSGCTAWLGGAAPCASDDDCVRLDPTTFCSSETGRCVAQATEVDTGSELDGTATEPLDALDGDIAPSDADGETLDAGDATDAADVVDAVDVMDAADVQDSDDVADAADVPDTDAEDADIDMEDADTNVEDADTDVEDVVPSDTLDVDEPPEEVVEDVAPEVDACDDECRLREAAEALVRSLLTARPPVPEAAWVRILVTVDTSLLDLSAADELAVITRLSEQFDASSVKLTFVLDFRLVASCFSGGASCVPLADMLALGHGALLRHDRDATPSATISAAANLRAVSPTGRVALTGDCGDPFWYRRASEASATLWHGPTQDCFRPRNLDDPGSLAEQAPMPPSRCAGVPTERCTAPAAALSLSPWQAWSAGPAVPTGSGVAIDPPGMWSLPWASQGLQLAPTLGRLACLAENEETWLGSDDCVLDVDDLDVWMAHFDAAAAQSQRRQVVAVDLRADELDTVEVRTLLLLIEALTSVVDGVTSDTPESLSQRLENVFGQSPIGIGGVWWVRESLDGPATYLFVEQSLEASASNPFSGMAFAADPRGDGTCDQVTPFAGLTTVPPDLANGPLFPADGTWSLADGGALLGSGDFLVLPGEEWPTLQGSLSWPDGCRASIELPGETVEASAVRVDRPR
jgi:hypothetical protein